jgi:hypothetical protein
MIEHFAIEVAPFDRRALETRPRQLTVDILSSDDEPDVVRFRDNHGIVLEVRAAG